jgi:hypothetical protein
VRNRLALIFVALGLAAGACGCSTNPATAKAPAAPDLTAGQNVIVVPGSQVQGSFLTGQPVGQR